MLPEIKITDAIKIDSYTLMLTIALIVLLLYFTNSLEKKNGYSREHTNKLLVYFGISLLITYIFASLFDFLFHRIEDPNAEFGGITYLGGFVGGAVAFYFLLRFVMKKDNINIVKIFNIIIPGVILAHAIGRIGCLLAGCCYGAPTNSIFGIIYPDVPYSPRDQIFNEYGVGVAVHPTQIYESLFLFGLFFFLEFSKNLKNKRLSIYLISYGLFRFSIEFIRGDSRGQLVSFLTPSQGLSLIIIIVGLLLLYKFNIKKEIIKIAK